MTFLGYEIYWDAHLIPTYIVLLLYTFFLLGVSLIAHELGHVLYFRWKKNKKVYIKFKGLRCEVGKKGDYLELSDKEYGQVNLYGILLGAVPIFINAIIFSPMILMLVPYGWAVRQDIGEFIKTIKDDDED